MTSYERAATEMEAYANELLRQCECESITRKGASDKFEAYIQCMVDNELCGGGFGANQYEAFKMIVNSIKRI